MKLPIFGAIITAVAATGNSPGATSDCTVNVYDDPAPISPSFEHNPLLKLEKSPTEVTEGADNIKLEVPKEGDCTFIWELTGFYECLETGKHSFSIGDTKGATIQLGFKSDGSGQTHVLDFNDVRSFSDSAESYELEKDVIYPIRVTFVAEECAFIYCTTATRSAHEINSQIMQIEEEKGTSKSLPDGEAGEKSHPQPDFRKGDFYYCVYSASDGSALDYTDTDFSDLIVVQEGYFDESYDGIDVPQIDAPHVVELKGHFTAQESGTYTIVMAKELIAGLQIGPGSPSKDNSYKFDSTWKMMDTRLYCSAKFEFEKGLTYPFRIVVLGNGKEFSWDISQFAPSGHEVDLFGLWVTDELTPDNGSAPRDAPASSSESSATAEQGDISDKVPQKADKPGPDSESKVSTHFVHTGEVALADQDNTVNAMTLDEIKKNGIGYTEDTTFGIPVVLEKNYKWCNTKDSDSTQHRPIEEFAEGITSRPSTSNTVDETVSKEGSGEKTNTYGGSDSNERTDTSQENVFPKDTDATSQIDIHEEEKTPRTNDAAESPELFQNNQGDDTTDGTTDETTYSDETDGSEESISMDKASNNFTGEASDRTINVYDNIPPLSPSFEHNPFLRLDKSPSVVTEGTDSVQLEVPKEGDCTFIWELTGFYECLETGKHSFSIGNTKGATIQIGFRSDGTEQSHGLDFNDVRSFSDSAESYELEKGVIYPIRVTFVADECVFIYCTTASRSAHEINSQIKQISEESDASKSSSDENPHSNPDFREGDFYYCVYTASAGAALDYTDTDFSDLIVVQEGYFDESYDGIDVPQVDAPHIVELKGHFTVQESGTHTIVMAKELIAGLQIGPGSSSKNNMYQIDSTWKMMDTRLYSAATFEFENGLTYPFRIVVLGNGQDFSWDISSFAPSGKEVDLFGLWVSETTNQDGGTNETNSNPGSGIVPQELAEPGQDRESTVSTHFVHTGEFTMTNRTETVIAMSLDEIKEKGVGYAKNTTYGIPVTLEENYKWCNTQNSNSTEHRSVENFAKGITIESSTETRTAETSETDKIFDFDTIEETDAPDGVIPETQEGTETDLNDDTLISNIGSDTNSSESNIHHTSGGEVSTDLSDEYTSVNTGENEDSAQNTHHSENTDDTTTTQDSTSDATPVPFDETTENNDTKESDSSNTYIDNNNEVTEHGGSSHSNGGHSGSTSESGAHGASDRAGFDGSTGNSHAENASQGGAPNDETGTEHVSSGEDSESHRGTGNSHSSANFGETGETSGDSQNVGDSSNLSDVHDQGSFSNTERPDNDVDIEDGDISTFGGDSHAYGNSCNGQNTEEGDEDTYSSCVEDDDESRGHSGVRPQPIPHHGNTGDDSGTDENDSYSAENYGNSPKGSSSHGAGSSGHRDDNDSSDRPENDDHSPNNGSSQETHSGSGNGNGNFVPFGPSQDSEDFLADESGESLGTGETDDFTTPEGHLGEGNNSPDEAEEYGNYPDSDNANGPDANDQGDYYDNYDSDDAQPMDYYIGGDDGEDEADSTGANGDYKMSGDNDDDFGGFNSEDDQSDSGNNLPLEGEDEPQEFTENTEDDENVGTDHTFGNFEDDEEDGGVSGYSGTGSGNSSGAQENDDSDKGGYVGEASFVGMEDEDFDGENSKGDDVDAENTDTGYMDDDDNIGGLMDEAEAEETLSPGTNPHPTTLSTSRVGSNPTGTMPGSIESTDNVAAPTGTPKSAIFDGAGSSTTAGLSIFWSVALMLLI